MNTPDAKAAGKGISLETALALSLCQLCLWHFPNPGTAVFQPMASAAGTRHRRTTGCPELEGMPSDHRAQHQWNPLQAAPVLLLRGVEAPTWRQPLLAANSTSTRIHYGSSGQALAGSIKGFCDAAVGVNFEVH